MKKFTTEEFIKKANRTHDGKYDYSKTIYIKQSIKVCIICPEHGEFWQNPNNHINGNGCPKCIGMGLSTNEFVNKANIIHNNKYDYTKTEYKGMLYKICVTCPEHGDYSLLALNHLHNKQGCAVCGGNEKINNDIFIKKAMTVHNNKYNYSKVEYKNRQFNVCIICPEHGEFWQRPCHHLKGCGCPICKESKLEIVICEFLDKHSIKYERQKRFNWLGLQTLDVYLPEHNIAIECQGEQHFKAVNHFGGYNRYIDTINRDLKKKKLCNANLKQLIYVYDPKFNKYTKENEIMVEIYEKSNSINPNNLYCFWK